MASQNPLEIDGGDLWEEWRRQSKLTYEANKAKADAKHALAQAKSRMKVTAAKLKLQIRSAPEKFGLDKITEDGVKSALEVHEDYLKVEQEVLQAEYAEDIYSAKVLAFVDRRKALENLVQLLSIEYHGEREPRPLSRAAAETLQDRERKAVRRGIEVKELEE